MPTLAIEGLELVVHLSTAEKLAAFCGGQVRFSLSSVTGVVVEPNAWAALRGIRAPGTGIPYVIAYGTIWRWSTAVNGPGCASTLVPTLRTRGWSSRSPIRRLRRTRSTRQSAADLTHSNTMYRFAVYES